MCNHYKLNRANITLLIWLFVNFVINACSFATILPRQLVLVFGGFHGVLEKKLHCTLTQEWKKVQTDWFEKNA